MTHQYFTTPFLLLFFCLSITPRAFSQKISYSAAKKLSTKTPEFRILGKNKEGVLIYKFGKSNHVIEAHSNNLSVRWSKNLVFKYPEANLRRLLVYPEKTLVFYMVNQRGLAMIYGEKWNSKFTGDGSAVLMDSMSISKYDMGSLVRVTASQNQSKAVCYYPVFVNDVAEKVKVIVMDDQLNLIAREEITVNEPDRNMLIRKIVPDNQGNVFLLLEEDVKSKKKTTVTDAFIVKMFNSETGDVKKINFNFQLPVFRKLYLEADNVNGNVVVAGLYTDLNGEEAQGYFFQTFNLEKDEVTNSNFMKFTPELIFEVTGKDTSKNVSGFYSFEIYDMVLRYDGGAILIAESRFDTQENLQVPSFTPTIGPSFRTISISYYNDVMALSVLPDGSLDWGKVLKKKQISEDDDGFFSSYCLSITPEKLNFIYNEEIYHKTNVSQYVMDKKGQFSRQYLFNAGDKNVLLVPRLGKQISSNEVLIPSYKRNYLSFVKVTY